MIDQEVYDQACDWIVTLDSGSASAAERARFVRWLNRRPQHAMAYEEMSQLWARMDTLGGAAEQVSKSTARATAPSHHFARWVAVPLTLILTICLYVVFLDPGPGVDSARYFVTAVDQYHDVVAADGSELAMHPGSSLQLEYSENQRIVTLAYGASGFSVKRDDRRPFVVRAGPVQVTVTGTRFGVSRNANQVSVRVNEGSVELRVLGKSGIADVITLVTGQSLEYLVETDELVWANK